MSVQFDIESQRYQRFFQPNTEAQCQAAILKLFETLPTVESILVATVDGHRVASAFTSEKQMSRLAAIVGSLCGLGETLVRENGQQEFRDVLITSQTGISIVQRLPNPGQRLIVLVSCKGETNMGMASVYTRKLSDYLSKFCFTSLV